MKWEPKDVNRAKVKKSGVDRTKPTEAGGAGKKNPNTRKKLGLGAAPLHGSS